MVAENVAFAVLGASLLQLLQVQDAKGMLIISSHCAAVERIRSANRLYVYAVDDKAFCCCLFLMKYVFYFCF